MCSLSIACCTHSIWCNIAHWRGQTNCPINYSQCTQTSIQMTYTSVHVQLTSAVSQPQPVLATGRRNRPALASIVAYLGSTHKDVIHHVPFLGLCHSRKVNAAVLAGELFQIGRLFFCAQTPYGRQIPGLYRSTHVCFPIGNVRLQASLLWSSATNGASTPTYCTTKLQFHLGSRRWYLCKYPIAAVPKFIVGINSCSTTNYSLIHDGCD